MGGTPSLFSCGQWVFAHLWLLRGAGVRSAFTRVRREEVGMGQLLEPTCATCGQEFVPVRVDQRYCCRWCREHRYLTRVGSDSAKWSKITRRVRTPAFLRHSPAQ
jgi:hypothetical protein